MIDLQLRKDTLRQAPPGVLVQMLAEYRSAVAYLEQPTMPPAANELRRAMLRAIQRVEAELKKRKQQGGSAAQASMPLHQDPPHVRASFDGSRSGAAATAGRPE